MSDPPNREARRELRQRESREWTFSSHMTLPWGASGQRSRAATPLQIRPSDWNGIFWRIYENVSDHRIVAIAAGVTFYALLAIFPGIAALVALYGLFADPSTISKHLTGLSSFLPGGAIDVIGGQLQRLTEQGNTKLGFAFLLSLAISIWSAIHVNAPYCIAFNGSKFDAALIMSYLARVCAGLNQFDDAWRCIGEALGSVETTKEKWCEADIYQSSGKIALMAPDRDEVKAETYFERALAVARQQQAKSWELRSDEHGEALARSGDRE